MWLSGERDLHLKIILGEEQRLYSMMEQEFKSFPETYTKITFALCVGVIYPNPKTDFYRIAAIPLMITSIMPVGVLILTDMYKCFLDRDIINAIRHSTVLGPFLGGFFKMFLMFHKRIQAKQIIDEITRDYLLFNNYHEKYKAIARAGIKNSQIYTETLWVITVIVCVMIFPIMAILLNTYNSIFEPEPVKYMVHDVNLPNTNPEAKFESPYFEIIFVYMCYCAVLYAVNFIGYDGFFGLSINHACLKMNLYCAALEDTMKRDTRAIYCIVVCMIKEQCRMLKFLDLIQDTFNLWLGIIFLATIIQICTCLFQVTEGYGFDLRYLIFMAGAVIHIYLPCRYSAKLKDMSLETADKFYSCGWENVENQSMRKLLVFMIARAQVPCQITALNIINFDMELFVSILQNSYSMFTLLRS